MQRNDQSLYQNHAETWWDGTKRFQRTLANQIYPRLKYFDRVAPDWTGLNVLDLGCGGGFMAEPLARRGARVTGIDPSAASLEAARKHAEAQRLDITYRQGVGEDIPLETGSMDRVVCVDVLEHVKDIDKVLSEVRRVLRPKGLFLFDTVNRNWLSRLLVLNVVEDVLKLIPKNTHDADKFIRPVELSRLLGNNGFTVKEPFVGMGPVWVNRRLDFVFGITPFKWIMYLGHAIASE
ncbi:MAG: bifunctional 2-polyprenyl-6-hydroxyphenol methylase/3-demethylubiquinol 3-O-methyltransferase UbiG [Dehalococcoidia bacterium]